MGETVIGRMRTCFAQTEQQEALADVNLQIIFWYLGFIVSAWFTAPPRKLQQTGSFYGCQNFYKVPIFLL
ncbi:hypothetical protein LJC34_03035 [Oscillospiraceae bacterium OttesenSCG-928-G22]|nr:hypothetical protein [Oscillospiraceae bacterium OttesenSCG-928-G22]